VKKVLLFAVISVLIVSVSITSISAQSQEVPSWIKNNAGWWAEGTIDDTAFLQGIQYLIKEGIMIIPPTESSGTSESKEVPPWIKNNAGWWAEGQIDDNTFVQGIQFLVKNGIIIIEQHESIPKDDDIQMNADKILQTWGLTGCERDDDATSNWRDITYYTVDDGGIILYDELAIPNELKEWQVYDDKHHESWSIFTQVVPPRYMNDVVWFTIFTDGIEWLEMDVFLEQDSQKWSLLFDIQDWYCLGDLDEDRVKFTMIHEFGHMLSLGPSEIDVDFELYDLGWEEDDTLNDVILEKEQACETGIITTYGCTKEDSYINAFAQKFQVDKYSDSINFHYQIYSNEWTENLWNYYTEHEDEYVTDYAASSTQEDFAETFTFFILSEKPQGNSVLEQKILFFYDYAELIEIRDFIRNNF